MFNFFKKIFNKEEKIDTNKFMFINDNDLKRKIVIDKKYNKELLIDTIEKVLEKYDLDREFIAQDVRLISLVFYKAVKELEKEIEEKYLQNLGKKLMQLTPAEDDELAKIEVFFAKHLNKLFIEIYGNNDLKDNNKDYIYTLDEISNIEMIIDNTDRLYFKERWQELLELNKKYKLQKLKKDNIKQNIKKNNTLKIG